MLASAAVVVVRGGEGGGGHLKSTTSIQKDVGGPRLRFDDEERRRRRRRRSKNTTTTSAMRSMNDSCTRWERRLMGNGGKIGGKMTMKQRGRTKVEMGRNFKRHEFEIERQIGEGSFGIVYQAILRGKERVVLKRPKLNIEGAAELQEIEKWMNDRVARDAKGSCAEFLGSYRVTHDEWKKSMDKNQMNDLTVKEGLWLVWKYQGDRTLAQFMAQSDYPSGLAKNLLKRKGVRKGDAACELVIAQKVMKQLLTNLATMHSAGLVHRDIKPHNLVLADCEADDDNKGKNVLEGTGKFFSESLASLKRVSGRNKDSEGEGESSGGARYIRAVTNYVMMEEPEFKLIDLGACACFRTGTNFAPDETIMDPKYAPPEEFLIPTEDAPDLRKLLGPLAYAAGSAAWVKHLPDRFDSYSAGVILMQLALPSLRTNRGLSSFNRGLKRCDYDLNLWRTKNKGQLGRSKTVLLDAGGDAGWKLAAELLKGRPYWLEKKAEKSGEKLDNNNISDRPSALDCLKFDFFSVDPAELEVEEGGAARIGLSISQSLDKSREILSDMFGLQKRIERQQTSIKRQLGTVQRLKAQGAPLDQIQKEEAVLEKMQAGLQGLFRSLQFKDTQVRTEIILAASSFKQQAKKENIDTTESFDRSMIKLKTREVLEKDLPKFAKNLSKQAGRIGDAATGAVLKILKSRDESDEVSSTDEEEGVEEDASTADDAINAVAVNDDENDESKKTSKGEGVLSSLLGGGKKEKKPATAAATTTTTASNADDAKKENETVVFKQGNSVEKVSEKRNTTDDENDGDKTSGGGGFLVSDMKTIRANMEAIEAEMNSIMQELAKLDTQLGVQELEEDENKEEGEEISLIVEQNDAKEPEDDMEDDDKDENVQKFKRIR
jgi:serine/threonine protein kinase